MKNGMCPYFSYASAMAGRIIMYAKHAVALQDTNSLRGTAVCCPTCCNRKPQADRENTLDRRK